MAYLQGSSHFIKKIKLSLCMIFFFLFFVVFFFKFKESKGMKDVYGCYPYRRVMFWVPVL